MDGALPMQHPEGALPAATANDKPELVPETEDNQDEDPEPQELPPLQRSRLLCQPVNQLTYTMTTKLIHASLDCEGELFCIEALFLDAIAFSASKDPDTMYMHQAINKPDKDNS